MRYTVLLLLTAASPLCADFSLRCLTLFHAEQIALEYNKQFLIAQEGSRAANERKLQAVSRWLPAINYYAEFRNINPKEGFFNVFSKAHGFTFSHQGYSSIFQLNQPLFSTDLLYGLKSKEFESQVYRFEQANTKNELLFAVRESYYAVIFYQNGLDIEKENIDYLSYALEQEQGKLEAGSSTPFEVNQSKAAVANAISLYYATLKDWKNARNALILTLGIDPLLEPQLSISKNTHYLDAIPEIAIKLQQLENQSHYRRDTFPSVRDYTQHIDQIENARNLILFSDGEVQEYLETALRLRPDLLAKKIQVNVAEQNVKLKKGNYYPKITGYVRYSYNDDELGAKPFFSQEYNLAAGVQLSWNLFDSFLREHEIREARAMRSASRIGLDQELQRIEVEIRNGLYQLEETLLTYLSTTQAVLVAEQAREQAQDKLQFGRIAPLEYRDSVNQLAQAKNLQNQASFDLISSYYRLRYATGLDANSDDSL